MTDAELPPRLTRLTFHGPLSEAKAARIVARLTANRPRTVLDIGCGWGELMLRVLTAAPDTTGLGLDTGEGDLASLADLAVSAGFRPAWIETATLEEWEDFESGYQYDEEEWLAAHPDHPKAAEISERLDQHRSFWLRGYYGLLGQAYLTLIPAG
jgi:trans-aconitate methyltransferase